MEYNTFSPAIQKVLEEPRLPDLGPGKPNRDLREWLNSLTVDNAFAPMLVTDRAMASLCLAGLWLWHDFLDESHKISQEIETPTGSYWHALMHRREPDFGNSKYWFRRVGRHPVFTELHQVAADLTAKAEPYPGTAFLTQQKEWDPFAFVDWCESLERGRSPAKNLARQIQLHEWQLLFAFCYRQAIGQE